MYFHGAAGLPLPYRSPCEYSSVHDFSSLHRAQWERHIHSPFGPVLSVESLAQEHCYLYAQMAFHQVSYLAKHS